MELDRQAERASDFEHAGDLRGRETDAFAEGIDGIDEAFGGERGQHRVADMRHVGVAVREFRRQGVGAQEGGGDGDGAQVGEAARGAELLALVGEAEAVAGLDLHRGDALGDERVEAGQGGRDKLVLGGRARGFHRRDDAAATPRDLLVGGAREAQFELARAVSRVDKMRVAIDEARRDPAALAVDALSGFRRACARPRVGDGAVLARNGAVLDDAEATPFEGHESCVVPEAIHACHSQRDRLLCLDIISRW